VRKGKKQGASSLLRKTQKETDMYIKENSKEKIKDSATAAKIATGIFQRV